MYATNSLREIAKVYYKFRIIYTSLSPTPMHNAYEKAVVQCQGSHVKTTHGCGEA
jgi:hypothetical protein